MTPLMDRPVMVRNELLVVWMRVLNEELCELLVVGFEAMALDLSHFQVFLKAIHGQERLDQRQGSFDGKVIHG
jgi:hypothetical protein